MHISVTFLLITFFGCIFSKLFLRIQNQRKILRFLIPILNFLIKKFFCSYLHFLYTLIANAQETAQKNGKSFLWMCLRILLGNHQRICITKLLKSLYPNAHPLSIHLPSPVKLQCMLQLSGQIHKPCFISSKNMYSVGGTVQLYKTDQNS